MKQKEEREYNISRVISAAQGLFINEGIYATSINRIAQEADLSPMSVYRYFNNKDTLVYSVWQDALSTFFTQFMEALQQFRYGQHDRLRQICCGHGHIFSDIQ
jgi:AcrR family transcriptional regulator